METSQEMILRTILAFVAMREDSPARWKLVRHGDSRAELCCCNERGLLGEMETLESECCYQALENVGVGDDSSARWKLGW